MSAAMASIIHHSTETATPRLKEFHLQPIFDVFEIQALEVAKRELRFLLVYLHSEDHQDTDRFCTEVK